MSIDGEIPSPELMRQIKDVITRVRGMKGPGVTNRPNTPISINPPPPPPQRTVIPVTEWLVKTTGPYSAGFPWAQVKPASAGGYTVVTGGRTSESGGKKATHVRGATSLPTGTVGLLKLYYNDAADPEPVFLFFPDKGDFFPAIVTASTALTAPYSWTYTVKFAESSAAGLSGFAAQADAQPLTAYNLFEKVDRDAAGTLELDPDGDGTDDGTIKAVESNSIVMISWIPTADGSSGAWYFERANSILANCGGA